MCRGRRPAWAVSVQTFRVRNPLGCASRMPFADRSESPLVAPTTCGWPFGETQATSFVAALAEKAIVPFLRPAHRTGRDHLGHPALGRVSRQGVRSGERERARGNNTPSSPKTTGM